ncbi:MAG: amino acid ABC transporter permease [Candidatus Pacebacteria bacterium]|nr:amino acid ABC transporter permease [Candidatus Paceibacterota bacterium]
MTSPVYKPVYKPVKLNLWQRLRSQAFNGWGNSLISLVFLAIIAYLCWIILDWGVLKAVFIGESADCKALENRGACWALIQRWGVFIIFGQFPRDEIWRPQLGLAIFVAAMFFSLYRRLWWWKLGVLWGIVLVVYIWLLMGGLGLTPVESDKWGGLSLTIVVAFYSLIPAFFLGILLALGRVSNLPAIKAICVGFIELVRGVPLISVLFMASVMVPLFFPEGVGVNKLTRTIIAFTLFEAAYMAESVRAGLLALPKGQYEAAEALGLGYWTRTSKIILPQSLKMVVPPLVNNVISTFKDTSLVLVIGLYDLLSTAKVAIRDVLWADYYLEVFIFIGVIYFMFCLFMSRYSQMIERILNANQKRS